METNAKSTDAKPNGRQLIEPGRQDMMSPPAGQLQQQPPPSVDLISAVQQHTEAWTQAITEAGCGVMREKISISIKREE